MSLFLSLLVCLAMAFGGGAELPAQPEAASQLTLSNVTLGLNGESVALTPEAVLTTAIGTDAALVDFKVNSEGETLLPVTAKLTADGIFFQMSDSGNVYSVTADTLMNMMELDEEDQALIQPVTELVSSYCALLQAEADPEKAAANALLVLTELMTAIDAQQSDAEATVNGQTRAATKVSGTVNGQNAMKVADAMLDSQCAELSDFMHALLDLGNAVDSSNYASFSEVIADEGEAEIDAGLDLSITATAEGDYALYDMSVRAGAYSMGMTEEITLIDDETHISVTSSTSVDLGSMMDLGEADDLTDEDTTPASTNTMTQTMTVNMVMTGPVNAPESIRGTLQMTQTRIDNYSYTTDDKVENYGSTDVVDTNGSFDYAVTDGLTNMNMDLCMNDASSFQYSDEIAPTTSESEFNVSMAYAEVREADESITGTFDMSMTLGDDELFSLGATLNRANVDLPALAQENALELTGDTSSEAYQSLTVDALGMVSDGAQLAANKSVEELTGIFINSSDTGYEDDYESSTIMLETFEDAAAYFDGEIPAITAPEGFALESVEADPNGYYITANYVGGEDRYSINIYAGYDDEQPPVYYTLTGGAMQAIDSPLIACYRDAEGDCNQVIIQCPNKTVCIFPYTGATDELISAIVAGIQF